MRLRNKAAAATFAAALSTVAGGTLATAPIAASAANPPKAVVVTMSGKAITLSTTSIPAGKVVFKVESAGGVHALQLLQLAEGYTKKQAIHDVNAAFGGDKAAIKRVDTKITWLGGANASPGHPGTVATRLTPGTYYATDQNGNANTKFEVVDAPSGYRTLYPSSRITTKHNRFHTHTSLALTRDGWMQYHNNAQEPHFIELNHVKQSTTKKDVADYIASGSQDEPPWALPGDASAGVISPGHTEVFNYDLPAGKYLVACFWPDKSTGMPHFYMGMYKLVELS